MAQHHDPGPNHQRTREWVDANGNPIEDHDRGLRFDLRTLLDRRGALSLLGGLGVAGALAACSSTSTGTSDPATGSSSAELVEVPDETAGPYPGDGSNGQDVLDDSGIVRQDICSSFGSSTTTAQGIPMTIRLTVKELATNTVLVGAAVYVWHCDRDGNYSMYSQAAADENYLRGVQVTDDTGTATFTSIFPACYSGRWPHIHFEVYENMADATSSGPTVKTSQVALPQAVCETVYATSGYEQSVRNLSQVSLRSDNVFGDDGAVHQLATMSGDAATGYTAALTVAV